MIDELKLLDTAIKGLVALRDKFDDDEKYQDYLEEHIQTLERKQAEKILEYEKKREDMENTKYSTPKRTNEDDWFDDE